MPSPNMLFNSRPAYSNASILTNSQSNDRSNPCSLLDALYDLIQMDNSRAVMVRSSGLGSFSSSSGVNHITAYSSVIAGSGRFLTASSSVSP